MKTVLTFLSGAVLVFGLNVLSGSINPSQHVYELRIYHANEGKLNALRDRFGDHTDPIFRRHNMKAIGYWMPEDGPNSHNLYVLEHPSREEAKQNWAEFQTDPEWKKVKAESETDGPLVDHIDSYYWMRPATLRSSK